MTEEVNRIEIVQRTLFTCVPQSLELVGLERVEPLINAETSSTVDPSNLGGRNMGIGETLAVIALVIQITDIVIREWEKRKEKQKQDERDELLRELVELVREQTKTEENEHIFEFLESSVSIDVVVDTAFESIRVL